MKKGIIGKKIGMTQIFDEKGNVVIPFGDLYEVDYDETYQGEEIKAMSAVAGKLYIVTEKTRDDLLNLHIFLTSNRILSSAEKEKAEETRKSLFTGRDI